MPITYAKTDEQVEEERRLLYVGVTRARCPSDAVLGAVAFAGRPGVAAAQPLPERAAPGRGSGGPARRGGGVGVERAV